MNAHHWPTAPRIAGLLAGAPRREFVQRHTITADGTDPLEWQPMTDLAAAFLERLKREHRKAIDNALGYRFEDFEGPGQNAPNAVAMQTAWVRLFASTPSASDALTAEFARRDEYLDWPDVVGRAA